MSPKARSVLIAVLAAAIAVSACVSVFVPLRDHDIFWHLKTGEWIWEHRALPASDPFCYTTADPPPPWARFMLTSYWLSQVLFHLLYRAGGMSAMIALRLLLLGLLAWALVRRREGDLLLSLGMLALALVALRLYPLERPQVFSFICFAALFRVLRSFREPAAAGQAGGAVRELAAVPLLMLLWANLHAGALPGFALIAAFLALEGAKFVHPGLGPMPRERYRRLAAAGGLGLLAALGSPNSWHTLDFFRQPPAPPWVVNFEYQSTLFAVTALDQHRMAAYWAVLLLTFIGMAWRGRKVDLTAAALLAALGGVSFFRSRYVPFFLVAAVPCAAAALSAPRLRRWAGPAVAAAAILASGWFAWQDRAEVSAFAAGKMVREDFPAAQADFVLANDLPGAMYNEWTWGGYLIWRLAPGRKVFADNRSLDPRTQEMVRDVDSGMVDPATGVPRWKQIFDAYGVGYAVVPFFNVQGALHPLVAALLRDPAWAPLAGNFPGLIFVRQSMDTFRVLQRYGVGRDEYLDDLIAMADRFVAAEPRRPDRRLQRAELLRARGRLLEARAAYGTVVGLDPGNAVARGRLRELAGGGR